MFCKAVLDLFHRPLGFFYTYCASQLVTGASERKQNIAIKGTTFTIYTMSQSLFPTDIATRSSSIPADTGGWSWARTASVSATSARGTALCTTTTMESEMTKTWRFGTLEHFDVCSQGCSWYRRHGSAVPCQDTGSVSKEPYIVSLVKIQVILKNWFSDTDTG